MILIFLHMFNLSNCLGPDSGGNKGLSIMILATAAATTIVKSIIDNLFPPPESSVR